MLDPNSFYGRLSASRGGDSPELIGCVKRSIQHLLTDSTDARKPGMLPGKIQSGKTRGFLGFIAHGFEKGSNMAIVLTKGTKALSGQTVPGFKKDFADFNEEDAVALFGICTSTRKQSDVDGDTYFIGQSQTSCDLVALAFNRLDMARYKNGNGEATMRKLLLRLMVAAGRGDAAVNRIAERPH